MTAAAVRRLVPVRAGRLAFIAAVLAVGAALGGCSSNGVATEKPAGSDSSTSAAPSISSSPPSGKSAVLAQYAAFWKELTPASKAPASQRRSLLSRVAVDPELKSLLQGMATADQKGQVFYGQNVPRPRLTQLSEAKGVAVVDDCQDSSRAGIARRSDNHRLTVGVRRNHVVATLHRDASGTWLVAFVSYSRTKC